MGTVMLAGLGLRVIAILLNVLAYFWRKPEENSSQGRRTRHRATAGLNGEMHQRR